MDIFINLSKRINILVKFDRTNYKNSLNIIKNRYRIHKPMCDLKQLNKFNEKSEKLLI